MCVNLKELKSEMASAILMPSLGGTSRPIWRGCSTPHVVRLPPSEVFLWVRTCSWLRLLTALKRSRCTHGCRIQTAWKKKHGGHHWHFAGVLLCKPGMQVSQALWGRENLPDRAIAQRCGGPATTLALLTFKRLLPRSQWSFLLETQWYVPVHQNSWLAPLGSSQQLGHSLSGPF